MALFIDTSALVKAYVPERRGSLTMTEMLSRPEFNAGIFVSDTVVLEAFACFAKKLRSREISNAQYQTARTELLHDLDGPLGIVEHASDVVERAVTMVIEHKKVAVGGIDCLHVASAEKLAIHLPREQKPVIFVAVDSPLRALAAMQGFVTFNPETEALATLLGHIPPGLGF